MREGSSTIAAHADHVLLTLQMMLGKFNNQRLEADWQSSWKLGQLNESEWNQLGLHCSSNTRRPGHSSQKKPSGARRSSHR